jgi:hypothetical protein
MIPATIACSYAFMLPIATPPNAIAYSTGYFKMTDMARPGMVMNIIGIGLLAAFIPTLGEFLHVQVLQDYAVFHLEKFLHISYLHENVGWDSSPPNTEAECYGAQFSKPRNEV